ncbi:LTA synthase family protein [Clostridium sp. 19966]|uniref:LTA synthase family protein n=1 Tax=Clostridium sp. 19966 TaxID=2768166 RepID=UPI0028DF5A04|nr:LTA synthase family protein [Clostridium sp. 19966]MDT8716789.1 LTA synthase family protein [Clostridium sp. 19966]
MLLSSKINKNLFINLLNGLKNRFKYLFKDFIGIYIFLAICIKNQLFLSILKSHGASSIYSGFDLGNLFSNHIFTYFILIFISFAFLFYNRAHLWFLTALNLIYSIVLIGDLWYYRSFNSFLSLHLLKETQNLNHLSGGVMSMYRPIDLIFIVDVIILIIVSIFLNKYYKSLPKLRGIFLVMFFLPLLLLLKSGISFKTQWIAYATMRDLSPIGYHVYDTYNFIDDYRPYHLSNGEKKQIQNWYANKDEHLPDNQYKGIFKGKNLVIIQVESLENFVLNNQYENQEITPNLNKLLKNSLYFPNYYEQVYNGTSSDADLMTNASVYPVRSGSTFFRFPNNSYNTLPKILNQAGYTSKAFHSDYGYYWNVHNALINFGFDKFMDLDSFPVKKTFWMGLTDECFLSQTADELKNTKAPFYGFAVTVTSHMPFKMPDSFKNLKLDKSFDDTYMGGYFQSVNYTDKQIGMFLNKLDASGLLDNTVVVIYGDHTSVHKYYSDEVAKIKPQEKWWDNGKRIPLIIYSKGMKPEEFKINGGQIDLLPTLAYAFGIPEDKYKNTALGRNLLNTKKSFALLADGEIIGKDSLSQNDINHINDSFDISDKLVRTNYFKNK